MAVDIETKDPNLKEFGDGAIRKDGRILGVGLRSHETSKYNGYWPADSDIVKDVMADKNITKIFHNSVYDLNWLYNGQGIPFAGRIEDTMTREQLLNAYADKYSLDCCCYRHKLEGKNYEDTIDAWWEDHGGKGKAIEHLDEIPEGVVRKYNEQDCEATLNLYQVQTPLLTAESLDFANDIECRLYPLLMEMKKVGIKVDAKRQRELGEKLSGMYEKGMAEMKKDYHFFDSLTAPTQLKQIWLAEGLPYSYTENGNPSFASDVLELVEHPVAQKILDLRHINAALSKFVDGSLMDNKIRGRIHATFYPALRDEGGTITGRFSCRDPNMQNISAREEKFGKEVRSIFVPDDDCLLLAFDYKQIEYKMFLNYACGAGAEEARNRFITDPNTDYHDMVLHMMHWENMKNARNLCKNFNFGSIYGLGVRSFAKKFRKNLLPLALERGITVEDLAGILMNEYFERALFVRPTMRAIQNKGKSRGYVRTLSGRRQRMPEDGGAYKLVNYLCQGSASDVCKKGLVDSWEAGIFNVLHPHITVHDENVASMPKTKTGVEASIEFGKCMENAYQIKVPITVDREAGDDWGHCKYGFYQVACNSIVS
jgi:DNA polymerase-1